MIATTLVAWCGTCRVVQCFSNEISRDYWVANHPHQEDE